MSKEPLGATRPLLICSGERDMPVATADSPNVVASVNGIANQAIPPTKDPFTAALGLPAITFCQ